MRRRPDTRTAATRETILSTAERLFAEHGVAAVSHRQISQEAGLGNNTAVGYHFGSRTELVRAVIRRHTEPMERIREEMVDAVAGSDLVRDWVACMVQPNGQHLADLGSPTWFGRFAAQVATDPVHREILARDALESPAMLATLDGLNRCLPELPYAVRLERADMSSHLILHVLAERERALAGGLPTPRSTWLEATDGLTDAITAIWLAPVTSAASRADRSDKENRR